MPSRIGIYPGSFDPIHQGHIAFSQAAMREYNLERVILLPEKQPRNKPSVTPLKQRLTLLKEVTASLQNIRVVALQSTQFTVENTLVELRQLYGDAELTLLVGSDVLQTMPTWPHLPTLLNEVSLAVGLRQGTTENDVRNILRRIETLHQKTVNYTVIKTPYAYLASTHVRARRIASA